MKYNVEYHIALAAKSYCETALDLGDFANCPVVTWFDPMAVDDANRVVCICQSAASSPTAPGNFTAKIEIGVKTQWAQPSLESDMGTHFDRVNQVRDIFNATQEDLIASLTAACPVGLAVTYINQDREYSTEVNEGNYYSAISITVHCHATTE